LWRIINNWFGYSIRGHAFKDGKVLLISALKACLKKMDFKNALLNLWGLNITDLEIELFKKS